MEALERVRKIAERRGKISDKDIDFLVAEGAKYGVEKPERTDCPDCWRDMAIRIAVAMRPQTKGRRLWGAAAESGVWFKGRLVTNPIDEETLRWLEEKGFPKHLLRDED